MIYKTKIHNDFFIVLGIIFSVSCFNPAQAMSSGKIVAAGVKPNNLFSDNMVLQKGVSVPVWGTAKDNEKITVSFNNQIVSTVAKNGRWMVKLTPMPYITTPVTMAIAGDDTVYIKNILVGEVWLCSGQSNMERQLRSRPPQPLIDNWEKERNAADYPEIREYYVPEKYEKEKIEDVNGKWTVCSPKTVSDFSTFGYFFARDLFGKLKVPVGIIFSAFGGTPAEDWTSEKALKSNRALSEIVKDYYKPAPGWQPEGKVMSGLYNGMIYPLIPYSIKGVAWYQGEPNNNDPVLYKTILSNMILNWRKDFRQGNFPFLIVQITLHNDMPPELRESQFLVYKELKNTALIVTTDIVDENIHSPHKQPVGERFTLAAEALAYGEKLEYSGPMYQSYSIKDGKIILHFSHTDGKLISKGTSLEGFTIAGADKKFITADAEISGNEVIVFNSKIKKPVAVRYGWENIPVCNLFNSAGLPASPFRSDVQ